MYNFSDMMGYVDLLGESYAPSAGSTPGIACLEDRDSPFIHLTNRRMVAKQLSIQTAVQAEALVNAFWLPGHGNPAGDLTRMERP